MAAALDPGDADTRHLRALLLLLQGRFAEGWAAYEARFDTRQGRADRRGFTQPVWNGEALAGRTILLHAEQGLGDTLQFCRYAPAVARCGGRVVLEVQQPLRRLLARMAGVDQVLAQRDALPDFELHCALLSLPRIFGTGLETIPADLPYLAAPPEALARWRARLPKVERRQPSDGGSGERGGHGAGDRTAERLRIGLVWAGNAGHVNDRRRSLPFDALAPLWAVLGVSWHSLQVGSLTADLAAAPPGLIEDLGQALDDFAETAAAVCHLDLVVTAYTAVAHLAGALGKPAFVLLPFAPDWRWMRARSASPWYPGLRLFRQDARRSWAPVIEAVAQAVVEFGI